MDGESPTPKVDEAFIEAPHETENETLLSPNHGASLPSAEEIGVDNQNEDKPVSGRAVNKRSKGSVHSKISGTGSTSKPQAMKTPTQGPSQHGLGRQSKTSPQDMSVAPNQGVKVEDKVSQPTIGEKQTPKISQEGELPPKLKKKPEEVEKPEAGPPECCAPPCVTLPCNIGGGNGIMSLVSNFPCGNYFPARVLLNKRNPFKHNPPVPEEGRGRVSNPSSLVDYIINLREDLADFQECHGLPRSRDYSFVSLGLALAQESIRAILSIICIFTELFPILAILSLILRFALDKLIDILQTNDPSIKMKKIVIFTIEMLMILVPLWLLVGIIFMPLITLILSVFRGLFHFKETDSESCSVRVKPRPKPKPDGCSREF